MRARRNDILLKFEIFSIFITVFAYAKKQENRSLCTTNIYYSISLLLATNVTVDNMLLNFKWPAKFIRLY